MESRQLKRRASTGTRELSSAISVGQPSFAGIALSQPRTAAVHLAVAPHGQLDLALMPTQITKPIGWPAHWRLPNEDWDGAEAPVLFP